jgi:hypothetical protein
MMPKKKNEKQFHDIKVKEWGSDYKSRYINVTKILPQSWKYIRVWEPDIAGNTITLKIECLYKTGGEKNES